MGEGVVSKHATWSGSPLLSQWLLVWGEGAGEEGNKEGNVSC